MNKLFSKIAIALASFAMVVGGASAAVVYGIEHVKPNYAIPAESILIGGYNNVGVGESISLIASSYGFTANSYTWTSGDESIATISGTGNTATVQGVNYGETYITASAQGANGVVTSSQFTINVQAFEIEIGTEFDNVLNLPTNTAYWEDFGYWGENGDVVFEVESSNTNAVTAEVISDFYYRVVISTGNIEGISATVTFTIKDNNGEPGYRTASSTIVVNVTGHYIAGDRVLALPEENNETLVLLANNDKTEFAYVDTSSMKVHMTNNIRQASLFALNDGAYIKYCFFKYEDDCEAYIGIGSTSSLVSEMSSYKARFPGYFNNKVFADVNGRDPDPRYQDYPGLLVTESEKYLAYDNYSTVNNTSRYRVLTEGNVNSLSRNENNYAGKIPPLFAYAAIETGPSITPDETSLTVDVVNYSASTNITVSKVTSLNYEILSGDSILQSVSASEIDDSNTAHFTVRAKDGARGTAVIRVKSATDDSVYTDITVNVKSNPDELIAPYQTQTKLAYAYEKVDDEFVYSKGSIRFGGLISKDVWNVLDEDYGVAGFGVMITGKVTNLRSPAPEGYTIANHVGDAIPAASATDLYTQLIDYYMPKESMAVPPSLENNYAWNLMQPVPLDTVQDIVRVYTAAAYIKLDNDQYVFFEQVETSVFDLAYNAIFVNGEDEGTAGGSLKHLIDMCGME